MTTSIVATASIAAFVVACSSTDAAGTAVDTGVDASGSSTGGAAGKGTGGKTSTSGGRTSAGGTTGTGGRNTGGGGAANGGASMGGRGPSTGGANAGGRGASTSDGSLDAAGSGGRPRDAASESTPSDAAPSPDGASLPDVVSLPDGQGAACAALNGKLCASPLGVCTKTRWHCEFDTPQCIQLLAGDVRPGPEVCTPDGGTPEDENCNGLVDEGCPCTSADDGKPCGTEIGALGPATCGRVGTVNCGGVIRCLNYVPVIPLPDCCGDGLDNDCDGVIDGPGCVPPGSARFCP